MNISGVMYESLVDGEGVRNTIFFSGCNHNCKGCHNPQTHDFNYGFEFTFNKQVSFIDKSKRNPLLKGITLSGGDPLYLSKDIIPFLKLYKKNNPTHDIWIYSGFTYEEIINNKKQLKLLKLCDVLVDGKFEIDKKDISLRFRGSKNQRVIDVQKSLSENKIILWRD